MKSEKRGGSVLLKRSADGVIEITTASGAKASEAKRHPAIIREMPPGYLANTDLKQPCSPIDYREADAISLSGDFKSTLF